MTEPEQAATEPEQAATEPEQAATDQPKEDEVSGPASGNGSFTSLLGMPNVNLNPLDQNTASNTGGISACLHKNHQTTEQLKYPEFSCLGTCVLIVYSMKQLRTVGRTKLNLKR
jgi:hypothetical protein